MYIKYIIYKEIGFFLSNASKSLNTAFFSVKQPVRSRQNLSKRSI